MNSIHLLTPLAFQVFWKKNTVILTLAGNLRKYLHHTFQKLGLFWQFLVDQVHYQLIKIR